MHKEFRMVLSAFIRYYELLKFFDAKNILASKHYIEQVERAIDYAQEVDDVTLIIDSGAFSVWNAGGKVDLKEYIDFLKDFDKKHKSKFREVFYVSLDVIPGTSTSTHITDEEVRSAVEEGFDNYLKFLDAGFDNVIHVIHQGDDGVVPDIVPRLLATNPKYIGISPSNAVATKPRMKWLDSIYNKIPKDLRTHGFAVTSIPLMRYYNWFSVDSTSWFILGVYGKLSVPLDKNRHVICDDDTPIYDKLEVSTSPRRIDGPDGYKTLLHKNPGLVQEIDRYIEYLCKKYPITPSKIFSERNEGRTLCNLAMFLRFERQPRDEILQVSTLF